MIDTLVQQSVLEKKNLLQANLLAGINLNGLLDMVQASEYELILFLVAQGAWSGTVPPQPRDYDTTEHNIDFGLFLYWLNNPYLLQSEGVKIAVTVLSFLISIPPSQIDTENYNTLQSNEYIYPDGTVISTGVYTTYDQGWFTAFFNLVETLIHKKWYNGDSFPTHGVPPTVPLSGSVQNQVTIAMVGDWGTGDAAAVKVMNQIVTLKPDYIIHLGDVYYAGSPASADTSSAHYFSLNQEVDNLIGKWPAGYAGKSFTLNSNHEMYCGANGYFNDALNGVSSPFTAQEGNSCFALTFGDWTIIGLDSAYMGTSLNAFMQGSIGGANGVQGSWIQSLKLNPAKTIALTHHTGFAYDCSSVYSLWSEINGALKGDPYAWYWGHVHDGIVYTSPLTISTGKSVFNTNTFARCLGHGALPYGYASALNGNNQIAWTEGSETSGNQLLPNGFTLLTLVAGTGGGLTGITEEFYDTSSTAPVWTKTIFTC